MKIYYQCGRVKVLRSFKGDNVSEFNCVEALSRFAEVYYSGQRFQPTQPDHGLTEYAGTIESHIPSDCDVYYIRSNKLAFVRAGEVKRKSARRIWMASPYIGSVFKQTDFLATFSKRWADLLKSGGTALRSLNPTGQAWRKAIPVYQVVREHFRPLRNHPKTKAIRKRFGGSPIIGHFGRFMGHCYPYDFLVILPRLAKKYPDIKFVTCLSNEGMFHRKFPAIVKSKIYYRNYPQVHVDHFPHDEVPYAISACDLVLICATAWPFDFTGCNKTKEAAACGVPPLFKFSTARTELFGNKYPFIIPTAKHPTPCHKLDRDGLYSLVCRALDNKELREEVARKIVLQAERFKTPRSATRLQQLLTKTVLRRS